VSTSLLYHAFGIRGYEYIRTDYQWGQTIFTIHQDPDDCRCSACGSCAVISRGHCQRQFIALPIGGRRTSDDRRITICVLGEAGPIVRRAQVCSLDEMMRLLEALPRRFQVCYEASCGYGHYHDQLNPIAARVTVAHPGRLRLIFRSKDTNDRKDAERLAKLLDLGEAPAVHVPSADVRTWRELITCRGRVVAERTRAKNSLLKLLRCDGVVPAGRPALWRTKGLEWLRRLELPRPRPAHLARRLPRPE
jgi:hypothetical protein